jgi:tetrahedral aminopeptidase
MKKDSKDFLYALLSTPSPSGQEAEIQQLVAKRMAKYADTIEADISGNLYVEIGSKNARKVMLAGHCDQIGFMITGVSEQGFLYFSALGGIDVAVIYGSQVLVHTESGSLPGVIGKTPIHLIPAEERAKSTHSIDKCWIDIGAKDKNDALRLVNIGDSATFYTTIHELQHSLITAPALDNRVGVFVVMEALRLCASRSIKVALCSVSTVQEELGLRGVETAAYKLNPDIGIAVDVTHANDNPGNESKKAPACKLGLGPTISRGPNTNQLLSDRLIATAKKSKIPHQVTPNAAPLGNDARAIQVSRSGVATAAIGIPNRYMHTQAEVCSLVDLEHAAMLLADFVSGLTTTTNFHPVDLKGIKKGRG